MDKRHSAIQKFQKALSTDFKCLLPLYNISLQYRHLGLYNAELECLNLLLSGLHTNSSSGCDEPSHHNVTILCSLIKECGFLSGEISEVQVLYLLAKRCYQLHRYDKASEKYRELIKLLTSEQTKHQHEQPMSSNLSKINLHQVHKEAAYCLLSGGYYDECIRICDKFLEVMGMETSCGDNTLSSVHTGRFGLPSNSEDEAEDDFFGLLTDERVVSELKQMRRQSQAAGGGGKTYNSASSTDIRCHDSMLAILYYKADALAHTGCICDALECLNRLTDMIENHQQERNTKYSKTKKQKLEDGMDTDDEKIFNNTEETMELLQCAYLNKSMLLMAEKRYTQALQVSRLAIQLNPGCVTSLYTHSLALVKLGRQREACSTWLSHRKLDVRGDSLHVQRLLQKQKELLRSSEKEDMEALASSGITSEDCLKLDIYCITYMRDKRRPVMS